MKEYSEEISPLIDKDDKNKAALKRRLEEIYRKKLDTQAEIAQIKAEAIARIKTKDGQDLLRIRDTVPYVRTLKNLEAEEAEIKSQLGESETKP